LKILNGTRDIVQLFSHAIDLDQNENIMNIFSGFGFQYARHKKYAKLIGPNFWHPGYAWAVTRSFYEKIGGLYDVSILGSGDHNMALSLVNNGSNSISGGASEGYKRSILDFQEKAQDNKLGYVPGVVRHYFHGTKANRKYTERWSILVKHQFDPWEHLEKNADGLLVPTEKCPQGLLQEIMQYFIERNEDDFLEKVL